jgi:hypothetical protein
LSHRTDRFLNRSPHGRPIVLGIARLLFGTLLTIAVCFNSTPACAQNLCGDAPPQLCGFGPYAGAFLRGGRGLNKPFASDDPLLASQSPWTMSLWFRAENGVTTTLLAGFGDPAEEDSRYLGLRDAKPILRMGIGNGLTGPESINAGGWHFLAATFDGVTARLFVDGREVDHGTPDMGPVQDAELMIAPDFVSNQREKLRRNVVTFPLQIPKRLQEWQHFGGKIAGFSVARSPFSSAEIERDASRPPEFENLPYEDGSKSWPFQVKQQVGYIAPQPPEGLPQSKAPFAKPVAIPVLTGPTLAPAGRDQWSIARNWRMQAAPVVRADGQDLSSANVLTDTWYAATVPGTVLTTLVNRGVYPDPYWDLNNLTIPESLNKQDYWYRVAFPTPEKLSSGSRYILTFHGINYAAQIWLNGRKVGSIVGAFLRGSYDVTDLLRHEGENALAVRISPPPHPGIPQEQSMKGGPGDNGGAMLLDGPTFVATEGWDWIPAIRDRDSGIWQDVTLQAVGPVALGDPQIITELPLPRTDSADVTIEVPLENRATVAEKLTLHASFEGGVSISKEVTASPGASSVTFSSSDFPQLHVDHPQLWWPNGYGNPDLYHLRLSVDSGSGAKQETVTQFGIREVTYELSLFAPDGTLRRVEVNPTVARFAHENVVDVSHAGLRQTPDGWAASLTETALRSRAIAAVTDEDAMTDLVIKVNGVRIAARGGNWGMDDAMKRISRERLEPYFRLHQQAGVNIIRNWVGQSTEPQFYELADEYGLMVWNDFWESTENYNAEAQDPELWLANAVDTVKRYRNHPSIVMWCGRNEGVPQPLISDGLAQVLVQDDGTRYYTPSSNRVNLRGSGPYQYQDPAFYFDRLDQGFAVELGVPSLSTLESLERWIAPENRWPVSDAWAYHDWHQSQGGDTHPFMEHLDRQFGAPVNLPDMERKAQMLDYTLHRAIFEGFNAHLWKPNSGRLIWMSQPAWPSNTWQMISSDYDTQASFYGVMKACEPQHVQLDLSTFTVDLINTTTAPLAGVTVKATVVSLAGQPLYSKSTNAAVGADAEADVFRLPLDDIFAGPAVDAPVFLRLNLLAGDGKVLSSNFYWLTKHDEDLRRLNTLPKANIQFTTTTARNERERLITTTLTNKGQQAALQLKLTLMNKQSGQRILPAYYSDNYVSLLPGESETVTIRYSADKDEPLVKIRGYNFAPTELR